MPAEIIDGKAMAATIREELKAEVTRVIEAKPETTAPGLAVVIVGSRKDSQTYVRLKHKAAEECGYVSIQIELPEETTQEALEEQVVALNNDPKVHGIIVQLPLPKHIDESRIVNTVTPSKDVDGLHPINIGLLMSRSKQLHYLPCTPKGVIEMLKRSGTTIEGKRAVVLGRSNIVGLPVSQLLMRENATVTTCHSRTQNTAEIVKQADIIVAACGQPELVRGDWVKPGAVIIDVGTNPVDDATKKTGYRLVGDVHFEEASAVAAKITPVPGGVGPMTIAMLLTNTMQSWKAVLGQ